MERKLMDRLLAWKDDAHRRPLVLRGARQTGKTWLLEEFGRRAFRSTVRIDFMREPALQGLFAKDLDPARIVSEIGIVRNTSVDPATTLLVFDEVQEAARGLTALKYFCEDAPEYHVVAAGSYMGIAMCKGDTSFPTGKVTLLTLHPMDFIEFLRGIGDTQLADYVISADGATLASMGKVLQSRLVDRLHAYLVVGGMPAAVSRYAEAASVRGVRDVQTDITEAYVADFAKHAPARILERMRLVWASLPAQLAKENKRFVFGALRRGARARDFEESIQWLEDFGAVIRVPRASALRIPLAGYEDRAAFKLIGVDVGPLGAPRREVPRPLPQRWGRHGVCQGVVQRIGVVLHFLRRHELDERDNEPVCRIHECKTPDPTQDCIQLVGKIDSEYGQVWAGLIKGIRHIETEHSSFLSRSCGKCQ